MTVALTAQDEALLEGASGEGAALAMRILVRMAELLGAPRFLDIERAHIDSALFQGDATLEYAERLAAAGARVKVPATLNVSGVDVHGWKDWAVPTEWAEKAHRQMQAYQAMGCEPTFTCAPYQTEARPALGQQIAWGESSAIVFANSVLGARTERYPDLLDICCAITGRAPSFGLHLEENRGGQVLIRLDRIPEALQRTPEFCAILGHTIGRLAGSRIPVICGTSLVPSEDQFKALGAAMASSGAVALFHWVGVTPEAPNEETALQGREPEEIHELTVVNLMSARQELTTAGSADGPLELVVLGSPHFSLEEFQQLGPLVEGRRRHEDVRFNVTCGRGVQAIARAQGTLAPIEAFGAEVTVDTCILTTPMLGDEVRTLMTNSPKFAYYTPGLLNKTVVFASLEDCVESAVQGRVTRSESAWDAYRDEPGSPERAQPFVQKDTRRDEAPTGRPPGRRKAPTGEAPGGAEAATGEAPGRGTAPAGETSLHGQSIIPGEAQGEALVTGEPLSFWGGYDPVTGEITDRSHPLSGMNAASRILVIPETRGSSTTTAVLLESLRRGTAPAAFVTRGVDSFLALAAVVAQEMYGAAPPVVALSEHDFDVLTEGSRIAVREDGEVRARPERAPRPGRRRGSGHGADPG